MTKSTTGQLTVLVTGASSGIGEAVARQFIALGHKVYGTSRNPETVKNPIPGVTYVRLDNADYATATACAQTVGDIDILINNAGESAAGAFEDTPMEAVEHLFRVNVFGPIALTKAVLPGMRRRRTGTVVMVGSMLSSFPVAFRTNYSATKSALKGYAMALRREVAPYGIRVTTVEPGTIATGIGDHRTIHIGDDSVYRDEYETVAAATRRNESKGIAPEKMAEKILEAALASNPKPLYARGNSAPLVFSLARIAPRQLVLDLTARKHGLKRVRR
ncbi:SDR family oxidoreductase [Gordonia sp. (in: high G+C Gram-positive bacteria)]|uniref:SDR family oxidoreductase n=1 Tax=Gordonia sp. (in: high G+C Gram-positive bacteria) TaxID=84139 RepID=UPI003C70B80D